MSIWNNALNVYKRSINIIHESINIYTYKCVESFSSEPHFSFSLYLSLPHAHAHRHTNTHAHIPSPAFPSRSFSSSLFHFLSLPFSRSRIHTISHFRQLPSPVIMLYALSTPHPRLYRHIHATIHSRTHTRLAHHRLSLSLSLFIRQYTFATSSLNRLETAYYFPLQRDRLFAILLFLFVLINLLVFLNLLLLLIRLLLVAFLFFLGLFGLLRLLLAFLLLLLLGLG